jgi:plastocyanin
VRRILRAATCIAVALTLSAVAYAIVDGSGDPTAVTSDDGKSFGLTVDAGKTATFTAPAAGTYKFHCNIHSSMHDTLTVT